jgi:hypothetical protein
MLMDGKCICSFVSIDIHANIPQAQIFEDPWASVKSKTYILCELLL